MQFLPDAFTADHKPIYSVVMVHYFLMSSIAIHVMCWRVVFVVEDGDTRWPLQLAVLSNNHQFTQ